VFTVSDNRPLCAIEKYEIEFESPVPTPSEPSALINYLDDGDLYIDSRLPAEVKYKSYFFRIRATHSNNEWPNSSTYTEVTVELGCFFIN
jgi:hypothetical protein